MPKSYWSDALIAQVLTDQQPPMDLIAPNSNSTHPAKMSSVHRHLLYAQSAIFSTEPLFYSTFLTSKKVWQNSFDITIEALGQRFPTFLMPRNLKIFQYALALLRVHAIRQRLKHFTIINWKWKHSWYKTKKKKKSYSHPLKRSHHKRGQESPAGRLSTRQIAA